MSVSHLCAGSIAAGGQVYFNLGAASERTKKAPTCLITRKPVYNHYYHDVNDYLTADEQRQNHIHLIIQEN